MSAIASADRMRPPRVKLASPDLEAAAFGTEPSSRLRSDSLSPELRGGERVPSGGGDVELSPLSPELALIDPELATAARAALADRPPAFTAPPTEVGPTGKVDSTRVSAAPIRRRRRLPLIAAVLLMGPAVVALRAATPADELDRSQPHDRGALPSVTSLPQPTQPSLPQPSPPRSSQAVAQTFSWVPTPGAGAYEFQLFRNAERVFRARVDKPRLELPRRWRQGGRTHELTPGNYRWYVWPVSRLTSRQSKAATVQARLVIERPSP